jgi:hypothetical protein
VSHSNEKINHNHVHNHCTLYDEQGVLNNQIIGFLLVKNDRFRIHT